jgi:hypothetical protein
MAVELREEECLLEFFLGRPTAASIRAKMEKDKAERERAMREWTGGPAGDARVAPVLAGFRREIEAAGRTPSKESAEKIFSVINKIHDLHYAERRRSATPSPDSLPHVSKGTMEEMKAVFTEAKKTLRKMGWKYRLKNGARGNDKYYANQIPENYEIVEAGT